MRRVLSQQLITTGKSLDVSHCDAIGIAASCVVRSRGIDRNAHEKWGAIQMDRPFRSSTTIKGLRLVEEDGWTVITKSIDEVEFLQAEG